MLKSDVETVHAKPTRQPVRHELDDLEQLLDDYDQKRAARPLDGLVDGEEQQKAVAQPQQQYSSARRTPASEAVNGSAVKSTPMTNNLYSAPMRSSGGSVEDSGQLDNMLGSLQSDMSKHGISTIPKGDCSACNKTIVGQVIIALGKMWHPEHFVCAHCAEELGHRNFFERGQKAYCENDYHNLFSPRCAYCNGPIKDRCITALEKSWHPEHFVCVECGVEFGEAGFHEKDGQAYCRRDYFRRFAPRCHACRKPIQNNYITALNSQWHPECFVCQSDKMLEQMGPLVVDQ